MLLKFLANKYVWMLDVKTKQKKHSKSWSLDEQLSSADFEQEQSLLFSMTFVPGVIG